MSVSIKCGSLPPPAATGTSRAAGTYRAGQDVGATEEAGHEHAGRALVDGARGADLDDAAGAHHRHAVGHGERLLQVVGHEQGGLAQAAQDARQVDQELLAQRAVEAGQRFVQHQQARVRRQRARQRHPLRLAAGQGVHRPPAEAAQPHQLQQFGHPPAAPGGAAGLRAGLHAQSEGDVALHVQVREQRLVLEHQTETAPVGGDGGQRLSLPAHLAGVRLQPGDYA